MLLDDDAVVSYSRKAWEPVSSRDSIRELTGSRSCMEMRWTLPAAMLAPVGKVWRAGEERGRTGPIFGEPRPQLHGDSWGIHTGWLETLQNESKKVILNTFWEKGDRLTPVTAVCLNPSWHKRKEEGDSFSHLFISRETLFSSLFLPKASHLFIYWSQRLLITDAK